MDPDPIPRGGRDASCILQSNARTRDPEAGRAAVGYWRQLPPASQRGATSFNAQVIEQGQRSEQRLLVVVTISASRELATRLDADDHTPVIVRRRLFLVEDQPVALCDSYYPAAMEEGTAIAEPRRVRGGALAVIEDPAGPIGRPTQRDRFERFADSDPEET